MSGSEELDGLRRAESQREVLLLLVERGEAMSSKDVAEALGPTRNAVNTALFNLFNQGRADRGPRGLHRDKMGPLLVNLLEQHLVGE
nr:hypothetical protein [Candidatus Bathyarchaeota archaeon]